MAKRRGNIWAIVAVVLASDTTTRVGIRYAQQRGRIPKDVKLVSIQPPCPEDQITAWRKLLPAAVETRRPVVLVPRNRDHPDTCIRGAIWERRRDLYVLAEMRPDRSPRPQLIGPS